VTTLRAVAEVFNAGYLNGHAMKSPACQTDRGTTDGQKRVPAVGAKNGSCVVAGEGEKFRASTRMSRGSEYCPHSGGQKPRRSTVCAFDAVDTLVMIKRPDTKAATAFLGTTPK
jgi:hypothetical protein